MEGSSSSTVLFLEFSHCFCQLMLRVNAAVGEFRD